MIRRILEAYAVGDAMGMPTEFMTRDAIKARFGAVVDRLLRPDEGEKHKNLPYASVTDDTEQVVYLLKAYRDAAGVDMRTTAATLQRWIEETGADVKGYIGPSSRRALDAIRNGMAPEKAGEGGTTCGGIMRSPAAVLYRAQPDLAALKRDLYHCLAPTHNTSTALEAAGAYGAALFHAMRGEGPESILDAACAFGLEMKALAPYETCAPSCAARIRYAARLAERGDAEALLHEAYELIGSGLPSADVCFAVFAIFCLARKDVWLAIRLGASVGGDTDTIAALAGALCAAHAKGHNIPSAVLDPVLSANRALLEGLC
jgi:ADP-ribosylglycohydrolase